MNFKMLKIFFAGIFLLLFSCAKEVVKETEVYFNDFQSGQVSDTKNLKFSNFNQSIVAGFYNNQELIIEINDLPSHSVAVIDFDLYIHDTWDGNTLIENEIAGPDIWEFLVDGNSYTRTTFSNEYCPPGQHCPPQAFPANYMMSTNFPRAGSVGKLPGVCLTANDSEGTTWYKISKTIKHTGKTIKLTFRDKLVQLNTNSPLCDESWSIDNLKVRVIQL